MAKEKTKKEKLEGEIANIKSDIKNTEYDLTGLFRGNSAIEEKLKISKEQLEKKQKLLEEISGKSEEEAEQIVESFENEMINKGEKSISEEQEKIEKEDIELEIEEQMTKQPDEKKEVKGTEAAEE